MLKLNLSKNDVRTEDIHPNVQELIKNNQLNPSPEEIDLKTGNGKWTIKGYKIWAESYEKACKMLNVIEKF